MAWKQGQVVEGLHKGFVRAACFGQDVYDIQGLQALPTSLIH